MLQQYEICGKEKERTQTCSACKDGEVWLLEHQNDTDKYYEDDDASKIFEAICSVCLTKYTQPKEFAPRILDYTNLLSWRKKINMEGLKMLTPKILEERKLYEETGVCFDNKFISSTVKTFEGTFNLQTCLITRKTKLEYNGKMFFDDLSNILNFLARKGMDYDKNKKAKERQQKQSENLVISFEDVPVKTEENIVFF